jgi:hypothetical protein
MTDLVVSTNRITAMSDDAINKVKQLEQHLKDMRQLTLTTDHVIHGGMYARSLFMPMGTVITGVLIKVPTILIISGHVTIWLDNERTEIAGYQVFACSAKRKQAFAFHGDTNMTMLFSSNCTTVAEAEEEFTDEADRLLSRQGNAINNINITGE